MSLREWGIGKKRGDDRDVSPKKERLVLNPSEKGGGSLAENDLLV